MGLVSDGVGFVLCFLLDSVGQSRFSSRLGVKAAEVVQIWEPKRGQSESLGGSTIQRRSRLNPHKDERTLPGESSTFLTSSAVPRKFMTLSGSVLYCQQVTLRHVSENVCPTLLSC